MGWAQRFYMKKTSYDYNTFKELFDSEIHYAYEGAYGVYIGTADFVQMDVDVEFVTFYKLTVFANGTLEYKGQWNTYDPKLWPQVLALGQALHETKAEKVLYAKKIPTE